MISLALRSWVMKRFVQKIEKSCARRKACQHRSSRREKRSQNTISPPCLYRNWCPHCLASRRPKSSHRSKRSAIGRSIPLFCAGYVYIRQPEEDLQTKLIRKFYPSHSIFAAISDQKGPGDPVVPRLADFLHNSGVSKLVYKSDQEFALGASIEKSLEKIQKPGQALEGGAFPQLVPEKSDVGESPSNGKAERAVQTVEDRAKTYLHALDRRLNITLPTEHPVMRWLVEHAANMLNRFTANPDGVSPYAALHGRTPTVRHT